MLQQAFFFDATRCSGCKTCVFACKDFHNLEEGTTYRRVYEYEGGSTTRTEKGFETTCFGYFVSIACCHCVDPICIQVCPTEAMHREDTGLVCVDILRCIGCGYCHLSCPYNAPKVDRDKGHSVKCDGCSDRILAGQKPVCIEACPTRALDYGTVADIMERGECANIAPLPDSSVTTPNLYIKSCVDACEVGSLDGKVVNLLELL